MLRIIRYIVYAVSGIVLGCFIFEAATLPHGRVGDRESGDHLDHRNADSRSGTQRTTTEAFATLDAAGKDFAEASGIILKLMPGVKRPPGTA